MSKIKFKLIPQLRNNCILMGKKESLKEYEKGDTLFLISKNPSKKYSILTKIEDIQKNDEDLIYIDKRILDRLAENDEVEELKCNPAIANCIYIAISNKFTRVFEGDWTPFARKYLKDKLIDYGNEISFLIPWKDEKGNEISPIPISGIMLTSIPPPPVKIGNKTKIFLRKYSNPELEKLRIKSHEKKEERVSILEDEMKQNIFQKIELVKKENYPSKAIKYKFEKTNPAQLFATIHNIFKNLHIVEEPDEKYFDGMDQEYLSSAVYYTDSLSGKIIIIDMQVISNDNSGELIIWITAEDEIIIQEFIQRYEKKIRKIKSGLEKKAKLLLEECPSCGAKLPLESMNSDGTIKCEYCRNISILPKSLRY